MSRKDARHPDFFFKKIKIDGCRARLHDILLFNKKIKKMERVVTLGFPFFYRKKWKNGCRTFLLDIHFHILKRDLCHGFEFKPRYAYIIYRDSYFCDIPGATTDLISCSVDCIVFCTCSS